MERLRHPNCHHHNRVIDCDRPRADDRVSPSSATSRRDLRETEGGELREHCRGTQRHRVLRSDARGNKGYRWGPRPETESQPCRAVDAPGTSRNSDLQAIGCGVAYRARQRAPANSALGAGCELLEDRSHAHILNLDASRSRVKLNALLDVYAGQSALNSTDALAIRLALREYAQYLDQVKRSLQHVADLNQITLDNKVIGIGKLSGDILMEPGR